MNINIQCTEANRLMSAPLCQPCRERILAPQLFIICETVKYMDVTLGMYAHAHTRAKNKVKEVYMNTRSHGHAVARTQTCTYIQVRVGIH